MAFGFRKFLDRPRVKGFGSIHICEQTGPIHARGLIRAQDSVGQLDVERQLSCVPPLETGRVLNSTCVHHHESGYGFADSDTSSIRLLQGR